MITMSIVYLASNYKKVLSLIVQLIKKGRADG